MFEHNFLRAGVIMLHWMQWLGHLDPNAQTITKPLLCFRPHHTLQAWAVSSVKVCSFLKIFRLNPKRIIIYLYSTLRWPFILCRSKSFNWFRGQRSWWHQKENWPCPITTESLPLPWDAVNPLNCRSDDELTGKRGFELRSQCLGKGDAKEPLEARVVSDCSSSVSHRHSWRLLGGFWDFVCFGGTLGWPELLEVVVPWSGCLEQRLDKVKRIKVGFY